MPGHPPSAHAGGSRAAAAAPGERMVVGGDTTGSSLPPLGARSPVGSHPPATTSPAGTTRQRPGSVNLEQILHETSQFEASFARMLAAEGGAGAGWLGGTAGRTNTSSLLVPRTTATIGGTSSGSHANSNPTSPLLSGGGAMQSAAATTTKMSKHLSLPPGATFPPVYPFIAPPPSRATAGSAAGGLLSSPPPAFGHGEGALQQIQKMQAVETFRRECTAVDQWFQVLSESERTSALYSLLQHLSSAQVQFFSALLAQAATGKGSAGDSLAGAGAMGLAARLSPGNSISAAGAAISSSSSSSSPTSGMGAGVLPSFHNPRGGSTSAASFPLSFGDVVHARHGGGEREVSDKRLSSPPAFDGHDLRKPLFSPHAGSTPSPFSPPGLSPAEKGALGMPAGSYAKRHSLVIGSERPNAWEEFATRPVRPRPASFVEHGHPSAFDPLSFGGTSSNASPTSHVDAGPMGLGAGRPTSGTAALRHSLHGLPSGPSKAEEATSWRVQQPPLPSHPLPPPGMGGGQVARPPAPEPVPMPAYASTDTAGSARPPPTPPPLPSKEEEEEVVSVDASPPTDLIDPPTPMEFPGQESPTLAAGALGTTIPIPHPSTMPLSAWLKALRLHKYTPLFEGMEWRALVSLSEEELMEKGVLALGARRKMLKVFESIVK